MVSRGKVRLTREDFERWLREEGHAERMGEENLREFLSIGLAGLLFSNSTLLYSFILSVLGFPKKDRLMDRARFEVGRRMRSLWATRDELVIELG